MILLIHFTGCLLVLLASLHLGFPKYFQWREELGRLSLINRQMFLVHTFFIAFVVLLMGVLCLTSANELLSTTLGRRVSLGMALFWFVRLLVQFFGYSASLWRGKRFETMIHILFTLLWMYLSGLFLFISF